VPEVRVRLLHADLGDIDFPLAHLR
jgi:hypothetical protein